ncbi:MAG: phosphodiester glycosidase family protein [Deltaproteobacteria bacterium]|nr:phosphodiester glycosidase family protein [Deltaproteobacteria bacterium]
MTAPALIGHFPRVTLRPHRTWLATQVVVLCAFGFIAARGNDATGIRVSLSHDWRETFAAIVRNQFSLDLKQDSAHALSNSPHTLPGIFSPRDVVFAAKKGTADHDLFRARVRFDPDGHPLAVSTPLNLTQTEAADESVIAWNGTRLAFVARVADRFQGLTLLDFAGESPALTNGWPLIERLKNRISNWQKTGAPRGVGETIFEFKDPPTSVSLTFDGADLVVTATDDSKKARIARVRPSGEQTGAKILEAIPRTKTPTEHVQWAVNTVRELPFIGHEFIAWLEQRVYRAQDDIRNFMNRLGLLSTKPADASSASVTTDDESAAPATAPAAAAAPASTSASAPLLGFDDTWPPAPIPLMKSPKWKRSALPGEGTWTPVGEPLITTRPGFAPPFYKSFVRTDPEREYARVVLAAIDVRQIELYILSGTEHPQPTTGHKGTGLIPREPDTMSRLVAAFNGGFQAMHGKAGMVVDRRPMLYPVPGLGTVATKENGDIAFLTWPKTKEIPSEFKSLRQNLAALVENGKFNPHGQKRWGYALPGGDSIFVHRSAIGVTKDGYLIYAFGPSLSAETLAEGMRRAGVVYAIHLDMNPWHCAFEFFKVFDTVGKKYKSTKLDPAQVFKFPRYLSRADPRDFFYLAYRKGLDAMTPLLGRSWSAATLPPGGGGIPPAWAQATMRTSWSASGSQDLTIISLSPDRVVAELGYGAGEPKPSTGLQPPPALTGWVEGYSMALDLGRTDPKNPSGLMVAGKIAFPPRSGAPTVAVTREGKLRVGTWGVDFAGTVGLQALKQGSEFITGGRAADLGGLQPDRAVPLTIVGALGQRIFVTAGVARPAEAQETLVRAGVKFAFVIRTSLARQLWTAHPKPETLDLSSSHLFLRPLPPTPRASVTTYKQ